MLQLCRYIAVLVIISSLAACASISDDSETAEPALKASGPSTPSPTMVEANTRFGVDMLNHLTASEKGNVFFSPLSLSTAMGLLYAGARGDTAEIIESGLYLPNKNVHAQIGAIISKTNRATKPLNIGTEYEDDPQVLSVQNSLWVDKQFKIQSDFKSTLETHYQAQPFKVDFKGMADASRLKINDWVESKTENRIQDLLSPGTITSDTKTVLVNSVYMKSHWGHFNESDTKPYSFRVDGENWEDRDIMEVAGTSKTDKFRFAKIGNTQSIVLPYYNKMSMIVILPPKGKGLEKLHREIDADRITAHIEALGKAKLDRRVNLRLPKFKLKAKYDLESALKSQDLGIIYNQNHADFSGISHEPLVVGKALQQVFLDVNEKGTEAAAATALTVVRTSAEYDTRRPVKFHVDRPFLMLIMDGETGAIVFMGRITNPNGPSL